jgi:hypothetical protein
MLGRAAVFAAVLIAGAGPAAADPQSEALLRDYVESVDALPDWSAAVATIRTDGDDTIAERLTMTRAEPRVSVAIGRLRLLDLSERAGSGFVASEIELTDGSLESDVVNYSIPSAIATEVGMPSLAEVGFDTRHLMTAIAELYGAAAEGELAELRIPEMTAVQRRKAVGAAAPAETQITYRDVVTSGLRNGVLRSQSFGPISISGVNSEGQAVDIGVEAVSAENLDLDAVAHIFDRDRYRDGRGDGVWRPLASRLVASGLSASGPDGSSFRIDSYGLENLDGRQPRKPITALWDRMLDPAIAQDVKNDLALEALQSALQVWRLGTIRLHGMTLDSPPAGTRLALDSLTVSGLSEVGIDSVLLKALKARVQRRF